RATDVLVLLAFVAVPLACTPALQDQFITAKWYALHGIALAAGVLVCLGASVGPVPEFVRRYRLLLLAIALLGAANTFRSRLLSGLSPLLDRLSLLILAAVLTAYVRRRGGDPTALAAALAAAVAATVVCGFGELLGWRPLSKLAVGDDRSAFFGNACMAGQ